MTPVLPVWYDLGMEANAVHLRQEDAMYNQGPVLDEIEKLLAKLTTMDDLKAVNSKLKVQWALISRIESAEKAAQFKMGALVKFHSKHGLLVGKVEGVNPKTVAVAVPHKAYEGQVNVGQQRWRVAPSLLMNADECEYAAFRSRVMYSVPEKGPAFGFPNMAMRGMNRSEAAGA